MLLPTLCALLVVFPGLQDPQDQQDPKQDQADPAVSAVDTTTMLEEIEAQRETIELTVQEALALALANNIDLELSKLETEIARYDFLGSWGSFDAIFDASLRRSEEEQERQNEFDFSNRNLSSLNLDFTQPITTGGSFAAHFDTTLVETDNTFATLADATVSNVSVSYTQPLRRGAWKEYATSQQREAEVAYEKQLEVQRAARQQLLLDVNNAYWDLVSTIEQFQVADSALDVGLEQLTRDRRRRAAGVGTEVEVLQAESEVAGRIEALLLAYTNVERAMDQLKRFLFVGKDEILWNTRIQPTTTLPEEVSREGLPTWTEALMVALEFRSDLRQQRLEVDMAQLRHQRTISERLAGIDLSLTASSNGFEENTSDSLKTAAQFEFPTFTALLTYNMPIGNRTANYAEQAARSRVRFATLVYDQLETNVVAEVRDAVITMRYQAEQVRAAEESLTLARAQLEAERARYNVDLSTNYQVLEFLQAEVEAAVNERTARVDFVKALVALRNAQGLLGEEEAE